MANKLTLYKKDGSKVADGTETSVTLTGIAANTQVAAGAYKVAFVDPEGKQGDFTDVPAFKTLTIKVTGVSLSKTTTTIETGKTESLSATVAPSNATDKGVTWASSATAVATVDGSCKVTAVKAGTADITVTTKDGSKTAKCTVTVKDPVVAVTGIKVNKATLSLEEGKKEKLTFTVEPSNATNKAYTVTSSNTAVATVDNTGNVTAVKAGTSDIVGKSTDGGKTVTCKLTVTAPPEPEPEPEG